MTGLEFALTTLNGTGPPYVWPCAEIPQPKPGFLTPPVVSCGRAAWREVMDAKFANVAQLKDGWTGKGSKRVKPDALFAARELLLLALVGMDRPRLPFVVPLSDGGIQIEWHRDHAELELAYLGSGRISALFEDRITGAEVEAEGHEAINLLLRHARRVAEGPDYAGHGPMPAAGPHFQAAA